VVAVQRVNFIAMSTGQLLAMTITHE
jgi:ABC-type uncharacterized transport system permease subunit